MNKELKELMRCPKCKKPLVPDRKAINEKTKKWDGHCFKVGCNCQIIKKGVRISVG